MTTEMTASETCSCGAQVQLTAWPPHVISALETWRRDHRHERPAHPVTVTQWPPPILKTEAHP